MQYQTESGFQNAIIELATLQGWMHYHTYIAKRSETGFPDLVLVRPPVVIFAEIKTEKGKIIKGKWNSRKTRWLPGQDEWGDALSQCDGVIYRLWRPSDWEEIERLLTT